MDGLRINKKEKVSSDQINWMKFVHISHKLDGFTKFRTPRKLKIGHKPNNALWLAPKGVWLDFIKTFPRFSDWKDEMVQYEFDIDIDKLIILKTYDDVKKFNEEFSVESFVANGRKNKDGSASGYIDKSIDWDKVKKETKKSGIYIVDPEIPNARRHFKPWYGTFDVESIAIWNKDAIKSFEQIAF